MSAPSNTGARGGRSSLGFAAVVLLALAGGGAWLWSTQSGTPSPPQGSATTAAVGATYVADRQCDQCHRPQAALWQASHHERAMQPANATTVLGDFNDAQLTHLGATTRFAQRDGRYFITTEGPDGRPAEYEVRYTFGVAPLQQYLVAFPGGRLQAPTVAWDVANKRWFALYPNDRHRPTTRCTRPAATRTGT